MPVKIKEINYLTVTDVLEELNVTRQTLWRWRQDGKVPMGSRFRNRQVVFSPDEVEVIRAFAHRLEPIREDDGIQLSLFADNKGADR